MGELYERTVRREGMLKKLKINIVSVWECEYDSRIKNDANFATAIKNIRIVEPLDPRKALFGGRVNALVLDYKVKPGEKIMYLDVVSEYPYVNKNKRYPVGKHKRITNNFKTLDNYFGIMHCKILPPRNLMIPILPAHFDKLIFTLCRTCAEEKNQQVCTHEDPEQRALTGTWCTLELQEAVKNGYELMEIHEVWHYPDSRERFFADYIDLFLALKVQASGWPADIKTPEQQDAFLDHFFQTEGIRLDGSKISWNPGLRQLAKLCLNSFWGRLGMRNNLLSTVFVNTVKDFLHYLTSSESEIHDYDVFSDDVVQIMYTRKDAMVPTNPKTNVVLAA
ncbi:uncharacterized protein LOC129588731 [Paramacrobiotus metropolitanus]|uniref:uncharacterized protein LOC129588731 n=1 Tax=Paramacrobiotus metropolitanus TaxID=2943436 RepID=UPI0024463FEB|nr:uncharacterized protein LOC129588731 [Paramacrobiotus metropolitanus]